MTEKYLVGLWKERGNFKQSSCSCPKCAIGSSTKDRQRVLTKKATNLRGLVMLWLPFISHACTLGCGGEGRARHVGSKQTSSQIRGFLEMYAFWRCLQWEY